MSKKSMEVGFEIVALAGDARTIYLKVLETKARSRKFAYSMSPKTNRSSSIRSSGRRCWHELFNGSCSRSLNDNVVIKRDSWNISWSIYCGINYERNNWLYLW